MREMDKKKNVPNNNHNKRIGKGERRERKLHQENEFKMLNAKVLESKTLDARPDSSNLVSDSNTGTESSEVYNDMVIHYVDDVYRPEEAPTYSKAHEMVTRENKDGVDNHLNDQEKLPKQEKEEEESDCETVKFSVSSQGVAQTTEEDKVERAIRSPKKLAKKESSESSNKPHIKALHNTPKKSTKSNRMASKVTTKSFSENNSKNMKILSKPSSESSEVVDGKPTEEVKEIDILDEAPNGAQSVGSEDETADAEDNCFEEDKVVIDKRIEEMELKIEKLEEELREIAALEVSLYSVVPEHGNPAHKVHIPARHLSRLYIHACKHWTQDKRATIARNTVSGLVVIAKSCGNDVSRLTFWLSNIITLREIISQAFGSSVHSSPIAKVVESNGGGKRSEVKFSSFKWKGYSGNKQVKKLGLMQFADDWQETSTFTAALEKLESWIFSRIVESVWWQDLTPHMQSPVKDFCLNKSFGRLLGPALGDQQQGSFSINLWKSAFQDASQRLCPIRAAGHECGCLQMLARMVMEECVARLDVAMFNAILRESAHEIPTDPISDPIVDSKVLPIPAGDLSFGSGAQLKNSVGNWSRWLTNLFGMDADASLKQDKINDIDDNRRGVHVEPKYFHLLYELSDLLMLPKDMLMDRSIRKEVCPSIGLPLVKRVLCNFTTDEFCPDPVPGAVLEFLNDESIVEQRLSDRDLISTFPFTATPVIYSPPSMADLAEKVGDGGKSQLERNVSILQRKGYTSDEELDQLDSPLTIIEKISASSNIGNGNRNEKHKKRTSCSGGSVRYELLREVWYL